MSFEERPFYRAVCDKCGAKDEGGEFQWWFDQDQAVEDVTENADWFDRTRIVKTIPPDDDHSFTRYIVGSVELLCSSCRACDVCGTKPAYISNDDNHLVCETHEDHEFDGHATDAA